MMEVWLDYSLANQQRHRQSGGRKLVSLHTGIRKLNFFGKLTDINCSHINVMNYVFVSTYSL